MRIHIAALLALAVFAVFGLRAAQLAVFGPKPAPAATAATAEEVRRGDLVDRNGALLATSIPTYTLIGRPREVWDPAAAARQLARVVPGLDRAATERRLADRSKKLVYLAHDLPPRVRMAAFNLGLAGIGFREDRRRVYPNGSLAAHVLGQVNRERGGAAGVELGLDPLIQRAGAQGAAVALSLDIRVQYAVESELARAARAADAKGGAAIVLDAQTGEALALASWPTFDANDPPAAPQAAARLNRVSGGVYEMGSTLKPLTVAIGIEAGAAAPGAMIDLSRKLVVDGFTVKDLSPYAGSLPLEDAVARSSNIVVADIALKLGAVGLKSGFARFGLDEASGIELPETGRPLYPEAASPLDAVAMSYGHGMAVSLAALAGAYTAFANDGERIRPTLLKVEAGDPVRRVQAISPEAARQTLAILRHAVKTGTGQKADAPGLEMAGKTGTAEKLDGGAYSKSRNLASFVGVFPASKPRYVLAITLDEPQPTAETGGLATGGAIAAPVAGRLAARIAPFLGLMVKAPAPALKLAQAGEGEKLP
jgi:cell division protein FtsI (penicillin-binding protein 3)